MNDLQRKTIEKLRNKGAGYKAIAQKLGLSVNTVKSHCRRNGLTGNRSGTDAIEVLFCKKCGKKLTQSVGAKQKSFCSDECRLSWWKDHPEKVKRKAYYELTCAYCQKAFYSYGNKNRKYCSHECYIADRFGGGLS